MRTVYPARTRRWWDWYVCDLCHVMFTTAAFVAHECREENP